MEQRSVTRLGTTLAVAVAAVVMIGLGGAGSLWELPGWADRGLRSLWPQPDDAAYLELQPGDDVAAANGVRFTVPDGVSVHIWNTDAPGVESANSPIDQLVMATAADETWAVTVLSYSGPYPVSSDATIVASSVSGDVVVREDPDAVGALAVETNLDGFKYGQISVKPPRRVDSTREAFAVLEKVWRELGIEGVVLPTPQFSDQ